MTGLGATLAAAGGGLLPAHGGDPGDLPALTWSRLFTGWSVEWLPLITIAITAGIYLGGVVALRRRGDAWSPWRTVSFVGGGMGTLLIATQSSLAAYDLTLLSAHMVQHMLLSMLAPIFMALGAPVTLALRTLPARGRGWLLAFLHSRFARVLTYPLVAGFLFIANPFVLYFTPLYEATLRHPWVHEWNHLHFVVVGCLWYFLIIGVDPLPNRMSYPLRMLAVFVTMPFHAFLGVAIMSANSLIAEDWYTAIERSWGVSPLADQRLAGGIIWGSGELVSLVVILALFVQWARDSDREARREDRRLDRLEAEARTAGESGLPDNGLWWESGRR